MLPSLSPAMLPSMILSVSPAMLPSLSPAMLPPMILSMCCESHSQQVYIFNLIQAFYKAVTGVLLRPYGVEACYALNCGLWSLSIMEIIIKPVYGFIIMAGSLCRLFVLQLRYIEKLFYILMA